MNQGEWNQAGASSGVCNSPSIALSQQWSIYPEFNSLQFDKCRLIIHEKNEFCGGDGFFGKKNWQKIWPKNGLKGTKIALNGLKWPEIA